MIRILVVDNFKPWHNFISATFELDSNYKVVGFASDGPAAVKQCRALKPDVILLDINLTGWSGMIAAQKIRQLAPEARIIFFTAQISLEFVTAAFEAGARGFVAKLDGQELLQAVNTVMWGEEYLSQQVREFRINPGAAD